MNRRRFLKGTGAALALGTGIAVSSQSATAAVTDKDYQIMVTPLDSGTYFDIDFGSNTDPVVAKEPLNGYSYTSGTSAYGSIDDETGTAVIGVDTYDIESIEVTDGPLAYGAEFIEENFDPVIGNPPEPERFCQIEVSGDGKYIIGIPFVSGVDTARGTRYGDAWEVGNSVEFGPSTFVGMDAGRRSVTFQFASQDNILAIDYTSEYEPVYNQFVPSDDELTNRSDPHDGVGLLGQVVNGGADKYQTAAFQKDPATITSSYDLYDPIATQPSWARIGAGVTVDVFTTNTDRGCQWV